MARIPIRMPNLRSEQGRLVDGRIAAVSCVEGQFVNVDAELILVESDDSFLTIESEHRGRVAQIFIRVGDVRSPGELLAEVDVADDQMTPTAGPPVRPTSGYSSETGTAAPAPDTFSSPGMPPGRTEISYASGREEERSDTRPFPENDHPIPDKGPMDGDDELEFYIRNERSSAKYNRIFKNPRDRSDRQTAFIVHGRDKLSAVSVSRFLVKIGIRAVLLAEEAASALTIMEKFERYADADFAICVLSPDDVGRLNADGEVDQPRARQNVIFEAGYFFGSLGRDRCLAMQTGDLELPSDILGIELVRMREDEDGWKLSIAMTLRKAKIKFDPSRLLLSDSED